MHQTIRRKIEMFSRVRQFGETHSALFPPTSRGTQLFTEIGDVLTKLQGLASAQSSSRATGLNVTTSKAVTRATLLENLDSISLTARALAVSIPGLDDKFHVLRHASDQVLLASARAFAANALPLKDQFIALHMPAGFLDDLESDIADFEATLSERRKTNSSQVNATSSMESTLKKGIEIVQQLKAAVHNELRVSAPDDDGLMTAWLRASRTERAHPKPATPPTPKGPEPGPPISAGAAGGEEPKPTEAAGKPEEKSKS